ncbi:MAG: argininosuccinate lyase [SAR324 cluster bacterium]|nr:argininosuccinate lyase [SAR324 cluster bacterium]
MAKQDNEKNNDLPFWLKQSTNEAFNLNLAFTTGRDVKDIPMADSELFYADIYTNLAHAQMLFAQKIITKDEHNDLKVGLIESRKAFAAGTFKLNPKLEDVHMNIEQRLTKDLKIKAAEKLHTARSRNDQVATDMKIYLRQRLTDVTQSSINLTSLMIKLADREKDVIMPGFTHYQPAMYTSFGHLVGAWIEVELRNITRMINSLHLFNQCPLGAGAGYGTSWPIDPDLTAKLLGFTSSANNTLDAVSSRGEMEAQFSFDLAIASSHWSRIAQDLILYSHPYFSLINVSSEYVTGSSIMPQKINLDFAEIIRAKTALSHGNLQSILSIIKGLPSGYNRDLQQTKYIILDLFRELNDIPIILKNVLADLSVNRENCLARCKDSGMAAIEVTNFLSYKYNLGFRKSYLIVSQAIALNSDHSLNLKSLRQILKKQDLPISISDSEWEKAIDPKESLSRQKTLGSPNPKMLKLALENSNTKLDHLSKKLFSFKENYQSNLANLLK